jgi:hypothetical protein
MKQVVLVLIFACIGQAANQTIKLEAAADASVSGSKIALLKFDVSNVPVSAVILTAHLHVFFDGTKSAAPDARFTVYDLGKEFTDAQALTSTLNRYSDYDVAPFSFRARVFLRNGEADVDVSALLGMIVATRRKTLDVAVFCESKLPVCDSLVGRRFADATKHPRLDISLNPTAPRAVALHPLTDDKFGPVNLDASDSSKPDGSKTGLVYRWWMETPAPGSSNSPGQELGREVKVKFEPDVPGLWTVRLRVTEAATKEFSETALSFTAAQLAPHPRLGVNDALLNQVKVLRSTKKRLWERFQNWLNAPQDPAYGSRGEALLYGYVVSKNYPYFEQAWKFYSDRLYVNGKDRSQGLRPFFGQCGKAIYCAEREAASAGGFLTMEIALLYDWGFDALNANQRVDVVEWLNNAADYNYRRNPYLHAHFGEEGAGILLGLAAASYATYGENRPASQQRLWFREEWAHTMRAFDAVGRGGAVGPPDRLGATTASAYINVANLIFFASAENLFLAHPWFQRRLAYETFAGGEKARENGLVLARRFPGTEEYDMWNWVFRQPGHDESRDAWTDIYLYSPAPPLAQPKRLSFLDSQLGNVFLQSGWAVGESTRIHSWAGPHVSDRQAFDQGSFSFLEKTESPPPGQKIEGPELIDFEDYFAHPENYDIAKVISFGDNGQAAAWSADITNAYGKPIQGRVRRRFVYFRAADLLLVADSAEAKKFFEIRAFGKAVPELSKFDTAESFGATFSLSGTSYKVTVSKDKPGAPVVEGMDLEAPVISNVKPGSVLPAGTTKTILSLNTNEPAQCRYGYKRGTAFSYMNGNFTTQDGLAHTAPSGALDGGDTYTYYIRCLDKAGNDNLEDQILRFTVTR